MSRRRLLFMLIFFTGTVLAALGWYAEWRFILLSVNTIIVAGHILQVLGLFGYMLTPDAIVKIRERHEEDVTSYDREY